MRDVEAHPLCWPIGQKKTPDHERQPSRFVDKFGNRITLAVARDGILHELALMDVDPDTITISSNVPLRSDGMPRGDWERRRLTDPGVAVYFTRKGRPIVIANDQYQRVEENMRAIEKTLEAMRGIERWGSHELLDRAFVGFTALPPPPKQKHWREILGFAPGTPTPEPHTLKAVRDRLARTRHPDAGGTHEAMAELNRAYHQALQEAGG